MTSKKEGLTNLIHQLKELLEQLGVSVNLYGNVLKVSGQTDYVAKTIKIDEPSAKWALCTLAHEGGHWLSYLLWYDFDLTREQREVAAFHLGWYLLTSIKAISEDLICEEDWYYAHLDLFDGTAEKEYSDWNVVKNPSCNWQ